MTQRFRNHLNIPGNIWFDHNEANINYDSENECFQFNIRGDKVLEIGATGFDVNFTEINGVTTTTDIGDTDAGTQRVVIASDSPYSNNFGNMYGRSGSNDLTPISISGYLVDFSGEGYRQMTPGAIENTFNYAITNINTENDAPSSVGGLQMACEDNSRTQSIVVSVSQFDGTIIDSDEIVLNGQTPVPITFIDAGQDPFPIFRIVRMYVSEHGGQQVSQDKPPDGLVHIFNSGAAITAGLPDNDEDKWASLELEEGSSTSAYLYVEPNATFYATTLTICKDGNSTKTVKAAIQYRPCDRDYGVDPDNKQWWITYGNYTANTSITIPLYELQIAGEDTGADIRLIAGEGINNGTQSRVTVKLNGFKSSATQ